MRAGRSSPSDVDGEEWEFVARSLCLLPLAVKQRARELRDVVNDLRWLDAACFVTMAHDLRMAADRTPVPTAAVIDRRTLQPTQDGGSRAGDDDAKRCKASKMPLAVDTLGPLLALRVTPADEQDRDQAAQLAHAVQDVTGGGVEVTFVGQGWTGAAARRQAQRRGMRLVVNHAQAKRGFVLLPRRRVVERRFARTARFHRLARDDERLAHTLAGLHFVAFVRLMLHKA